MPLNLIEKFHALGVTDVVNVWHYPERPDPPRFYYWFDREHVRPGEPEWCWCNTLEELIEKAYEHIDPLKRPLPEAMTGPGEVRSEGKSEDE